MNEKSNVNPGPSEVRGISDPPDMGRLRPAEEVASEFVDADGDLLDANGRLVFRDGRKVVAHIVRQSRAEGAAAALEEAERVLDAKAAEQDTRDGDPRDLGKADAYADAASLLRARAKGISDPPDMG